VKKNCHNLHHQMLSRIMNDIKPSTRLSKLNVAYPIILLSFSVLLCYQLLNIEKTFQLHSNVEIANHHNLVTLLKTKPTCPAFTSAAIISVEGLKELQDSTNDDFNAGLTADDHVLSVYYRLSPSRNKIMIDVGANKGLFSFQLAWLWESNMYKIYGKLFPSTARTLGDHYSQSSQLIIHAIEPVPDTFNLLKSFAEKLPLAAIMTVHNLAISDTGGYFTFYSLPNDGDEQASLTNFGGSKALPATKVITLDEFMIENKLSHIDLLKLDGEGYDPHMLYGAKTALTRQSIDVLQFEYNGKWREVPDFSSEKNSLKAVVQYLDSMNYDTFLIGTRNLYQLNRGLWNNKYEFWSWSNCVALSRKLEKKFRKQFVEGFNLDFPSLEPV
jgi:FkbM family methyltransferase